MKNKDIITGVAGGCLGIYAVGITTLYTQTRRNNKTLQQEGKKNLQRSKDLEILTEKLSQSLGAVTAEKGNLESDVTVLQDAVRKREEKILRLGRALSKQREFHARKREERRRAVWLADEEVAYEINGLKTQIIDSTEVINDLTDEIARLTGELNRVHQQYQNSKGGGGRKK